MFTEKEKEVLRSCGYSPSAISHANSRGTWPECRMNLLKMAVKGYEAKECRNNQYQNLKGANRMNMDHLRGSPSMHGKLIFAVIWPDTKTGKGQRIRSKIRGDIFYANDGNTPIAIVEGYFEDGKFIETARHNPNYVESIIWLNDK